MYEFRTQGQRTEFCFGFPLWKSNFLSSQEKS